jgi:hypothetical protein
MFKHLAGKKLEKYMRVTVLFSLAVFLYSCATIPGGQSQIDSMLVSSQYSQALEYIKNNPNLYGKKNELLYLLDKGLIEHLAEDYTASIETFAEAQKKFDELYTESVTDIAQTWIFNDYSAAYRGEDFERVQINIFQSINYLMTGQYDDALVEARDVDSKLNAINFQYESDQKNVYKEDAFARFLMGILYEIKPTGNNLNDSFISYSIAEKTYAGDYNQNYGLNTPELLKENLLSTAKFMGFFEFSKYRTKFKSSEFMPLKDKQEKAEVYLIQYNGLSPIKKETQITVPTFDNNLVKIAFPEYSQRPYGVSSSRFLAKTSGGEVYYSDTELAQDIGKIAQKNLERRKMRYIAKSALRATGRYLIEKKQTENIKKKKGNVAADLFSFVSKMYNLIIEQADLRCWQTLPDQIRIARIVLDPGKYDFVLENFNDSGSYLSEKKLNSYELTKGQKLFIINRTVH